MSPAGKSRNAPRGSFLERAVTRATASVDRGVVRLMERQLSRASVAKKARPPEDARARLLEAAAVYADLGDAFFTAPPAAEVRASPAHSEDARTRIWDLSYPSHYLAANPGFRTEAARYQANATVHARLFSGGPRRPAIVCLHGWGGGAYWLEHRAFVVDYWLRHDHDVVLFQLPYHGDRTPLQAKRSGALFPSPHVVRTNEAIGQAIWDLRALHNWLLDRGAPSVGAMGMSLGGYTTAVWASVDARLAFAAALIPAVDLADLMWEHGANLPSRRHAEKLGVSRELIREAFAIHAPLGRRPLLPAERLFILAGRGDRVTPPAQAEALWQHWGRPEIHWFAGSHLAQIGRGDGFRKLRRKLDDLRSAPARSDAGATTP